MYQQGTSVQVTASSSRAKYIYFHWKFLNCHSVLLSGSYKFGKYFSVQYNLHNSVQSNSINFPESNHSFNLLLPFETLPEANTWHLFLTDMEGVCELLFFLWGQMDVQTIDIYLLEKIWNRLDPWLLSKFMLVSQSLIYLTWEFGWTRKLVFDLKTSQNKRDSKSKHDKPFIHLTIIFGACHMLDIITTKYYYC